MAEILLIDDDPNIHQIVSLFLEDDGHNVKCVSNGPSGLDFAAHNTPDLIILDLAMPEMDGIETFEKLRASPSSQNVPVMILTVHDATDMPHNVCTEGCVGFVNKPVNMEQLKTSVREALAR